MVYIGVALGLGFIGVHGSRAQGFVPQCRGVDRETGYLAIRPYYLGPLLLGC